jgi:hypothetical protein
MLGIEAGALYFSQDVRLPHRNHYTITRLSRTGCLSCCAAQLVKLVVCAMVRCCGAHGMLMLHLLRKVPAHALGLAAVRSRLRVPGDSVGASDGRGRVGYRQTRKFES